MGSDFSYTIILLLSTCPLHTNSGCGKREAHINWTMVTCKIAAPFTGTTLRTTGPVPADPWAGSAIGTQLRDPINSGLTRWRMAV